jgi:hypothetical protein
MGAAREKIYQDVPAWLSLILAGRSWPASEASAANHHYGVIRSADNTNTSMSQA